MSNNQEKKSKKGGTIKEEHYIGDLKHSAEIKFEGALTDDELKRLREAHGKLFAFNETGLSKSTNQTKIETYKTMLNHLQEKIEELDKEDRQPIVIMPENIWIEKRLSELEETIERFGEKAKISWLEERKRLKRYFSGIMIGEKQQHVMNLCVMNSNLEVRIDKKVIACITMSGDFIIEKGYKIKEIIASWRENGMKYSDDYVYWRGGKYAFIHQYLRRLDVCEGNIFSFRSMRACTNCKDDNVNRYLHCNTPIVY